jgi:NhaA family Na+:H+ antiporter
LFHHPRLTTFIISNSLLLPAGALLALAWANVDSASYDAFAHAAHFLVNDVGMTLFFALAAKEIVEATAPGGSLHPPSKAATPIVAAVGGMTVPALCYLGLVAATGQTELVRGWAIPTATDIAFSFLIVRWLFGRGHSAVPFLLLLAIADDALGLVVLATFYPAGPVQPIVFAVYGSAALLLCWSLRRARVTNFWPYVVIAGAISWMGFYRGGLHPALALIPVIAFIPHAVRDAGLFEPVGAADRDPLDRFEHIVRVPTEIVLFLFGLVNAGVRFDRAGAGTWIVLASLLIGKPIGICLAVVLTRAAGAVVPAALSYRDVLVLGCTAGIGFTVALFFCTAAFPAGELLEQTKMGALLSFGAAPLALIAAAALRVGRFGRTRAAP